MLGGSGIMRRIGVPGFAEGGYIGREIPVIQPMIPASREDMTRMENRLGQLEVTLNINKLNSAQNEWEVVTTPQRI
jgi:hypothetical protein